VVRILVSAGSELPIYRQIMRQISDAIAGGRLHPGDKLPSHRELAGRLVIAPLTVKKAYDELERDGVIRSERGRGTFVASSAQRVDSPAQRERLRESVRALLSRAHLGGVPLEELLALVREVDGELESERAAGSRGQEKKG
jgi:GntR family transcriptional regulator